MYIRKGSCNVKALITGASSGIGRDMAFYLASMGYDVILVARRENRLEEIAREINSRDGGQAFYLECDLSKRRECVQLYKLTRGERIDLLVNNAGFGFHGYFSQIPLEKELEMIETNIAAVHILTKLFLRDMMKRGAGHILNVASSAGFLPGPMLSTYYATKSYVLRLSEGIYEELKRQGSAVKISVLCPGPVRTEFDKVANVRFSLSGLDSKYVAKYAVDKALKGKLVIVPGFTMKAGIFARRFVSEKLLLKASYNIQKRKGGA